MSAVIPKVEEAQNPVFIRVPESKRGSPLATFVAREENHGLIKRRNDFCDRVDQSLLEIHVSYRNLLNAQPSMPPPQQAESEEVIMPPHRRNVVPPHTQIAIDAHSQLLAFRAEQLLQLIHELKVHILTILPSASDRSEAAQESSIDVDNSGVICSDIDKVNVLVDNKIGDNISSSGSSAMIVDD